MRAHFFLASVSGISHARHYVALERIPFFEQLVDALLRLRRSTLDNPCRSPDCPAERALDLSSEKGAPSTDRSRFRARFLKALTLFWPTTCLATVFVPMKTQDEDGERGRNRTFNLLIKSHFEFPNARNLSTTNSGLY